ncbi:hypothetical protein L4D76_24455 [Photobacterium sagamiensis]|uniref:hypothetical protein n=1 Tax=Photobacterium sagamiensis TaxID=2910241 RepID=UPI003D0CBF5B
MEWLQGKLVYISDTVGLFTEFKEELDSHSGTIGRITNVSELGFEIEVHRAGGHCYSSDQYPVFTILWTEFEGFQFQVLREP